MVAKALLLALALLAAGCVGAEDPVDLAAPPATQPPAEPPAAEAPEPAAEPSLVPALRDFPVAWDGQFGRGACVPDPTGGCTVDPLHEDTRLAESFEPDGAGRSLAVELSWTPDTPAMERLVVRAHVVHGEESRVAGEASGESPLPLAVEDLAMAPGDRLVFSVGQVPPVGALSDVPHHAWTRQPFHLEGVVVVETMVAAP